jgi:hypothetical protein
MTMRATTVFDYIVQRLVDGGMTDCFGVPDNYPFPVCDAVERNPHVKWIGCSNEFHSLGRKSFSALEVSSYDLIHGLRYRSLAEQVRPLN